MKTIHTINKSSIQSDPIYTVLNNEFVSLGCKTNDHLLISVSGGMDSMALLSLCVSMEQFSISVAHINHHLRENSDEDELLVVQVCEQNQIPCYVKNLNPASKKKGDSIEAWGRQQRYNYLSSLRSTISADWILTAHHSNDQAETILLNLSRKSGVSGLRGIAKKSSPIVRPFLNVTKTEIKSFVESQNIQYREDESNSDISIPRNFLRHTILPNWELTYPDIISSLNSSANYFKEWQDALDFLVIQELLPKVSLSDNQFEFSTEWFKSLPKMAKIRLVQILTKTDKIIQWSKHEIDSLDHFLNKDFVGHQIKLKNGWSLLWDRHQFMGQKNPTYSNEGIVELNPNSTVDFNQYRYALKIQGTNQQKLDDDSEQLDWSKLAGSKLEIRHWKAGDTFQPLGMKGHQKISDFLINKKTDRFSKQDQTVMTANGNIVWVCGQRIADWVKITQYTKEIAVINRQLIKS